MSENHPRQVKQVGRPAMPAGYGLKPAAGEKDLLPWSWAEEQLLRARNYWVVSASKKGRPHAMPVWGVWIDGALLFGSDPVSRKGRNMAENPEIVVHLESGDDVVILEGSVGWEADPALLARADQAYFAKYEFHLAEDPSAGAPVYRFDPRVAFAWTEKDFISNATRWQFKS